MRRGPFIVDVVALRRHPGRRERVTTSGRLPGLAVSASAVPSDADVALDITLEAVDGGIIVRGRASAVWSGECRRCLTPLTGDVIADLDEVFASDPEEGETWPIAGDHIDLEPVARESIVLGLPLAPVCAADCRGLCPVCGADRNQGECGCGPPAVDPRWAGLEALRLDDRAR